MKKILALILIIASLSLPLTSCKGNEPSESGYVNDRFIFQLDRTVLKRYDLFSRTVSVACPDPLCDHGEACVVSDISGCRTSRNCVYFYKDGFRCYNPARNEIKLIFESGAQVFGPGQGVENTVYFTVYSYDYDDNGMIIGGGYDIYGYLCYDDGLPRKILGYATPEELFDLHLDRIYAA